MPIDNGRIHAGQGCKEGAEDGLSWQRPDIVSHHCHLCGAVSGRRFQGVRARDCSGTT